MKFNFNNKSDPLELQNCVTINIWFQGDYWIIQKFDQNEREIFDEGVNEAEYYNYKKSATSRIPSLFKVYPEASINIFKSNGEHQRTVVNFKKPKTRKEQVDFLRRKLDDSIIYLVAPMNDREFKSFFEEIYTKYKNEDDYIKPPFKMPECLVCGSETETIWKCSCGHAIIDESDTGLQELKDNGEYDLIREKYKTIIV